MGKMAGKPNTNTAQSIFSSPEIKVPKYTNVHYFFIWFLVFLKHLNLPNTFQVPHTNIYKIEKENDLYICRQPTEKWIGVKFLIQAVKAHSLQKSMLASSFSLITSVEFGMLAHLLLLLSYLLFFT